jgi:glycosyltransferase involved in cell wall biosynthesis
MAPRQLAACLICKDEEDVIGRCLDSCLRAGIDSWAVCDTGSTDRTRDVVMEKLGHLPGRLENIEWTDFADCKTRALAAARSVGAEFALLVDADDVVRLTGRPRPPRLVSGAYRTRVVHGSILHHRTHLVRTSLPFTYRGVRHEYVWCDEPFDLGDAPWLEYVVVGGGARRSKRAPEEVFLEDARALVRELERDPEDLRTMFYAAQSWRDAGRPLEALAWYRRRAATARGWAEERYVAAVEAARIALRMVAGGVDAAALVGDRLRGAPSLLEAAAELLAAWELVPDRAEAPRLFAEALRLQGLAAPARAIARAAARLPVPTRSDALFVDVAAYGPVPSEVGTRILPSLAVVRESAAPEAVAGAEALYERLARAELDVLLTDDALDAGPARVVLPVGEDGRLGATPGVSVGPETPLVSVFSRGLAAPGWTLLDDRTREPAWSPVVPKKLLHQVWIGPKPAPERLMRTWREKHPGWEYRLWTNGDLAREAWANRALIDACPEWAGKADLMRYEILLRSGGVAVDADSECLGPLDEAWLRAPAFAAWEHEIARPGLLATGIMGARPGSPLFRALVAGARDRAAVARARERAWQRFGPAYFTEVARSHDLLVLPSYLAYPEHAGGLPAPSPALDLGGPRARQLWGSTLAGAYDRAAPPLGGPLVTVVTCCHRQARFLAEALDSVRRQTYPNWEVVVACGGRDEDIRAARAYKRWHDEVLARPERVIVMGGLERGPGDARNAAIRHHARGAYVVALDADDRLHPEYLARAVALAEAAGGDAIVSPSVQEFGDRFRQWDLGGEFSRKRLLAGDCLSVVALFSRELWDRAGGYPVAPYGSEDWAFWIEATKHARAVLTMPERLHYYRAHALQGTHDVAGHQVLLGALVRSMHAGEYAPAVREADERVIRGMKPAERARLERRRELFPGDPHLRRWLA